MLNVYNTERIKILYIRKWTHDNKNFQATARQVIQRAELSVINCSCCFLTTILGLITQIVKSFGLIIGLAGTDKFAAALIICNTSGTPQ